MDPDVANHPAPEGFPDLPKGAVSNAPYTVVFKQAADVTLLVLESLNGLEMIRDAARFTFARLSNALGSAIVPYIPPLITSLLADCHAAELVDFLPFTGLLVHRFSPDIAPTLSGLLVPLVERVFVFLNTTPSGTDEAVLLNDLKKSYLNFLGGIFNAELEGIFVNDGKNLNDFRNNLVKHANMSYLNTILQSVLHYATNEQDIATAKLAFSVINKMVAAWGGGTTFAEEAQKALKAHNQKSGKAST
ncbi:MAG: hypothetical protein BJ554DRAFT_2751 [Olpidium bornovanus]|uniref:Exportin-T n=1 Tax=Olpidium bornovanus TaxID=278681 RepID=A0A8H8DG72_9FUNG|nr:MAG: hypothetical protein BJ554DRAFT_2751 [Olpidium bornovanus]